MNAAIELQPHIETYTETHWFWGACNSVAVIVSVTLAVTITLELIIKFFVLKKRKRIFEEYTEKKLMDMQHKKEKIFWEYLREKTK